VLNVPDTDKSYPKSRRGFFNDAANAIARLGWQTNELLGDYPGGGAACGGSSPDNAVACTSWQEFRQMLFRASIRKAGENTAIDAGRVSGVFPQNAVASRKRSRRRTRISVPGTATDTSAPQERVEELRGRTIFGAWTGKSSTTTSSKRQVASAPSRGARPASRGSG